MLIASTRLLHQRLGSESAIAFQVFSSTSHPFYRDGGAFLSSLNNEMVDRMKAANS